MSLAKELAQLFRRDITRLLQEVNAFPDAETLWRCLPGASNSAGNLVLHLEGNLREFIGRQLGGVAYQRVRDLEFSSKGLEPSDLAQRVAGLVDLIPNVIERLTAEELETTFPENVFGVPLSTEQFVISLLGHLNYHLGQIDYLRRILTNGSAIKFAGF